MDIVLIRAALQPFVEFFVAIYLSGVGVAYVTQALKAKSIPVPAQKYPRTTALVLSLVATLISIYVANIDLIISAVWQIVVMVIGILLISALTYRRIIGDLEIGETDHVVR